MFMMLIRRHQAKIARWKAKFGLSDYQVFWMGFGEGLIVGVGLGVCAAWLYLTG